MKKIKSLCFRKGNQIKRSIGSGCKTMQHEWDVQPQYKSHHFGGVLTLGASLASQCLNPNA